MRRGQSMSTSPAEPRAHRIHRLAAVHRTAHHITRHLRFSDLLQCSSWTNQRRDSTNNESHDGNDHPRAENHHCQREDGDEDEESRDASHLTSLVQTCFTVSAPANASPQKMQY